MQGDDLESAVGKFARSPMPRVIPSSGFVRDLGEEIQRAAYQRVGHGLKGGPFDDVVIELRKLARLLRRTLVPVSPRVEFTRALRGQLAVSASETLTTRQQRRRWLVLGGAVGSVISLAGLVAALLLRRRNQHLRTSKPFGVV